MSSQFIVYTAVSSSAVENSVSHNNRIPLKFSRGDFFGASPSLRYSCDFVAIFISLLHKRFSAAILHAGLTITITE
jgi:hypothetical protein